MLKAIDRKRALSHSALAFALVLATVSVVGCFAWPATAHSADEPSGYWQFTKSEVVGPEYPDYFDGVTMSGGNGTYKCDAVQTDDRLEAYHGSDRKTTCVGETANIVITVEEPPMTTLKPGQEIAMQVGASFSTSSYYDSLLGLNCNVRADIGYEGSGNSQVSFSTGDDKQFLGIDRTWKADDYYGYGGKFFVINEGGDQVFRAKIPESMAGRNIWVGTSFAHGRGEDAITTYYYYDWVEPEIPPAAVTSQESSVKDESGSSASSTDASGKSEGSTDKSEESAPKQDVVINTNASKDKGDSGSWVIPLAIVGGLAVVGGAVAFGLRGRKKGDGPDNPDDDQKEEEPSTFRMVLWKECGDTLFVGGGAQTVGARIVEDKPNGGGTVDRDDLTARLSFGVTDNIKAEFIGMQGPNKCINVEAIEAGPMGTDTTGVVAIEFAGDGASFTNNVKFKIEELRLEFPDVALTFVAGQKQTFKLPFRFSEEALPEGFDPDFEAKLTTPEVEKFFRDAHVVRTDDYPGWPFAVEMTECGEVGADDVPGTMESYQCSVTATVPPGPSGQERKLEGEFNFFRFHEGLRFTCEPLKCYYEKLVTEEESLVYADEAFDIAAKAQAAAMGVSGGVQSAIVESTTQVGMREAARDVKERFPELFEEDQVFVMDKYERERLTPARTHAYLTLFVVEERKAEDGTTYLGIRNPLPKREQMQLIFEDVPGSSVLQDKDGKDLANPIEELDVGYFIGRVDSTDNTVVFDIVPTKGILKPPNRSKVKVSAHVEWNDRSFDASETVLAISQPYRLDYQEKEKEYQAADDEITDILQAIQAKILGNDRYAGGLAKKGEVSLTEAALDAMADAHYDGKNKTMYLQLRYNIITAPGVALYELYKGTVGFARSISNQWNSNIYYDDLMPLYHHIESMIQGHAYEFGYCEPMVNRVVKTFGRFEKGELGSAEAIDLAYMRADMLFADTLAMTVRDWNHSWLLVGVRIGAGIISAGETEWIFVPLAAITAGMEGSLKYIDKGGDSLFEAYRVGLEAAAKQYLTDKAIEYGVGVAVQCVKGAVTLTKEAVAQRQLFYKAFGETLDLVFTSAKYGKKLTAAIQSIDSVIVGFKNSASSFISEAWARGAAKVAEWWGHGAKNIDERLTKIVLPDGTVVDAGRQSAFLYGRAQGAEKVELLRKLVNAGPHDYLLMEKRYIVLAIQSDKHAMRALTEMTGSEAKAVKALFNEIMGDIEKKALHMARVRLSERLKIPVEKIKVRNFSGNSAAQIKAGDKVPMDMDAMFEYLDDATGEMCEVDYRIGQECFDLEFYKICRGTAAESADAAKRFAIEADMVITNRFHPEAYGTDSDDVLRVVDKLRAGEKFTNPEEVGRAAKYKCEHWMDRAEAAMAEGTSLAKKAAAAGGQAERVLAHWEAAAKFAKAEACIEESIRQFTKQSDRLIINKLAAMRAAGIAERSGVNIKAFLEKVALLKQSGLERFGGRGLSTAEVEAVLRDKYGTTLRQLYADLEKLTVDLDEAIGLAQAAGKGATYTTDDIVGSVIGGIVGHTDDEE